MNRRTCHRVVRRRMAHRKDQMIGYGRQEVLKKEEDNRITCRDVLMKRREISGEGEKKFSFSLVGGSEGRETEGVSEECEEILELWYRES